MSRPENGGGERARTDDLLRARQALSQLSYTPVYLYHMAFYVSGSVNAGHFLVGLDRFELSTSRLSGVRSNQLSYRPVKLNLIILGTLVIRKKTENRRPRSCGYRSKRCLRPERAEISLERR